MRKWINSRILIFAFLFIGLAFIGAGLFTINSNSKYSKDNTATIYASSEKIIPLEIKIPSIGVDASIKPVGLTKLKTMESPDGPAETVWFEPGASPGEKGSSVIAGHRSWKKHRAVFDDLDKIKIGDKVYVEDENKNTLVFVVREMRVFDADEVVPEVWNKMDTAHLNLITCSGDWNILTGTSDKRLVVFTDLIT